MNTPKLIHIDRYDIALARVENSQRQLDAEIRRARDLRRYSLTTVDGHLIEQENAHFRKRMATIERRRLGLYRAAELYNDARERERIVAYHARQARTVAGAQW